MTPTRRALFPEFVYGSIDGLVTTFAIIASAEGASVNASIILVLGVANVLADGFSMASSNFLSEESRTETNSDKSLSLRKASVTFGAFVLVGCIPLLPYATNVFTKTTHSAFSLSIFVTAITFVGIGALRGKVAKKNIFLAITQTVLVGGFASTASYLVGKYLESII